MLVTPPFTGGLFLGSTALDLLSSGPFVIDHDQNLGMQGTAMYRPRANLWTSVSTRYDSGLVSNPSDPKEVAADPDYADLLPYVNLGADPPAREAAHDCRLRGRLRATEERPRVLGGGLPGDKPDQPDGALQLPVDLRGHATGATPDPGSAIAMVLVGGET